MTQATPQAGKRKRAHHAVSSLLSRGEPMVWLTAGGLILALSMVAWLLGLVLLRGMLTFWPAPVHEYNLSDGTSLVGQVTRVETIRLNPQLLEQLPENIRDKAEQEAEDNKGLIRRFLIRTGNYELTQSHFNWIYDVQIESLQTPEHAVLIERLEWGRFYGTPIRLISEGDVICEGAQDTLAQIRDLMPGVLAMRQAVRHIERDQISELTRELEKTRLDYRIRLKQAADDTETVEEIEMQFQATTAKIETEVAELREQISQYLQSGNTHQVVFATAEGQEATLRLMDIVRVVPANQLSFSGKLSVYFSRWFEFLIEDPREANSEGGVFPAIFGTVLMTMIMCVLVVPFGVMAALYLREYARAGLVVSAVRISINNLAGVPSIVFGVFGLGFFCYIVGAQIDELFYAEKLPNPTFGKGALIWASFTLALLTLPVVIVATEEAIAAVPNSMREGSYACGASKWQTIQRIVLPRAMPGILTGAILAMARGAGEVAPLMIVGAVKLAPELPLSLSPSEQFGINRSFMHLGFHIYDLGFQSQNSEAARPMVYTTTLLLILIVAFLNIIAIILRSRLRRRFKNAAF